jgi:hypothetical protein
MPNLDPQVQIKLIEISSDWTEKTAPNTNGIEKRKLYLESFYDIYKHLLKTISPETEPGKIQVWQY